MEVFSTRKRPISFVRMKAISQPTAKPIATPPVLGDNEAHGRVSWRETSRNNGGQRNLIAHQGSGVVDQAFALQD